MPLSDLSNPDVLLRENWNNRVRLSADGTPLLPPSFVAEVGARVWIVDVRDDDELVGATGHIPGVCRIPLAQVGDVADKLPAYTPVILVCDDGERSRTGARYLNALGMTTVAAMDQGMVNWRAKGYGVSRDSTVLQRSLEKPRPGQGSDGRQLATSAKKATLTGAMIEEHVGDPAKVRRVKLAAFLLATQTSCVDGREDRAIIGTPGGDSGELLLSLAAVESVTGQTIDLDAMPAIVQGFVDTFGGIYLHTDNGALNRLTRSLRLDNRLGGLVANFSTIDDWETFLREPPDHAREALMDHLIQPNHVGCGHLKLALIHSDDYEIRPELITSFFRAFYTNLWNGAPDHTWVVLGGAHAEGAVVNVMVDGDLGPFTSIPMIAPAISGVQMFVNHPQVVEYLRRQHARFLLERVGQHLPLANANLDTIADKIGALGGQQTGHTLTHLASGLPIFTVHFRDSGDIDVSENGAVG